MLNYVNLSDDVRKLMSDEVEADIAAGKLYQSPRLGTVGWAAYPDLLRQAIASHDDRWLETELRRHGRINATETRKTKKGTATVAVPITAAETLAEGEFNRYYVRGLCRFAIDAGAAEVFAYRAKQVANPRPESQAMLGRAFSPASLLNDLRTNGIDNALGLPPGPNSGLSVRLPD